MNDQSYLRDLLLRSFDAELPAEEAAQLVRALEREAWLREEAAQWRELRRELRALHPAPRPEFTARVMAGLPRTGVRQLALQRLWPLAVAASLVALVVAVGWVFTTSGTVDKAAVLGLDELNADDVYVLNDW